MAPCLTGREDITRRTPLPAAALDAGDKFRDNHFMYKIRGGDGNEYGPVSADQVRQWISEGRANGQTLVLPDGLTEWKPIASLPEFASLFAAPSLPPLAPASPSPHAVSASARQRVQGPAIGLMITGIIGLLSVIGFLVLRLVNPGATHLEGFQNAEAERLIELSSGALGLASNLIGIAIGVVILVGAIKMKNLSNHGFAMAAAILAMIPCTPCCCLGLPIGIWALIVLMKPEVKAAFP